MSIKYFKETCRRTYIEEKRMVHLGLVVMESVMRNEVEKIRRDLHGPMMMCCSKLWYWINFLYFWEKSVNFKKKSIEVKKRLD
jgi:hypothetical protein